MLPSMDVFVNLFKQGKKYQKLNTGRKKSPQGAKAGNASDRLNLCSGK